MVFIASRASPLSSCDSKVLAYSTRGSSRCARSVMLLSHPLTLAVGSGIYPLKDFLDLFLECLGGEGLDDVAVDAGLSRLDDLFTLGFGSNHQHRQTLELVIGTHGLQQLDSRHPGHIPVSNKKIKIGCFQQG